MLQGINSPSDLRRHKPADLKQIAKELRAETIEAVSVTGGLDAKSKAVPLRFSFSLNQLPAGRYKCQVSVIDPASQKAAFWQAPVMLLP